jgi:hypothetical protein
MLAPAVMALAIPVLAQTATPMPLESGVEKELAGKASNVTEVTLGKNMLEFAAKFMNGNDADDAATRKLIEGLDGIYVRDYDFEKEGEYSPDDVEKLRQSFETSEWTSLVREREKKTGESTDVMVKLVNGEQHGMFILSAEPKELCVVLILGPIRMDQLGALKGLGGLGQLGNVSQLVQEKKDKEKKDKEKLDKDKLDKEKQDKDKQGGSAPQGVNP